MENSLIHYETLVGQVGAEGITCLISLAIESPQPLIDLAGLIKRGERYVMTLMQRCLRFGYVGPVAPLDLTVWHITNKGREMLGAFFRLFLGSGSDPRQLALPLSGSDPVHLAHGTAGSNPAAQEVDGLAGVTRAARAAITHSDHDHDQSFDQDHELNESEHAARTPSFPAKRAFVGNPSSGDARDLNAVAAALDRHGIRDLPGKPNRTTLLQDAWVTPERIDAAIERARNNPKRLSPSPVGLAVAELLHHRPEIDDVVASRQPQDASVEDDVDDDVPIVATDHPMAKWWQAAKGEMQLEMTRATFETWVAKSDCVDYDPQTGTYVVAVPNAQAAEWLDLRLRQTVERILTGINGNQKKVRFVVWREWTKQHSTN